MTSRLFLSYARADDAGSDRAAYNDPARSFMRRLYNALVDEFDVWWDMESMPSRGEAFTAEIAAAIDACDRFVLVVAPGALRSDYVRAEWTHARETCKPVTPILRAGDYDLIPAELKVANASTHAVDFRDSRPFGEAVLELKRVLSDPVKPLGGLYNFRRGLPKGHIRREAPYQQARAALLVDEISATVVSAAVKSAAAVYGQAGLGKSTLATALAHDCDVRRRYSDGVLWIEIGRGDVNLRSCLAQIGVHFGDARENYFAPDADDDFCASRVNDLLRGKRALIILDDVWDHRMVAFFRVTGTPCRLLITTRSTGLADRVGAADVRVDALSDDEGAALIAGRAGGRPDDPLYKQISRELGGHTLAVRIAADQLTNGYADDAADLLGLLRRSDNPLKHLKLDDEDKDENVEKSLWLSYSALTDDLQRRFRALGVMAPGSTFDRAALAAVWGDADPDDARRPLAALLDASLLDLIPGPANPGEPRYSQHPLLRAYARALLAQAGEEAAVFQRYADWVIEESEAFQQLPLEQWSQLDPLIPHVTEVGDALVDHFAEMLPERLAAFGWNVQRFVNNRMTMIDTPRGLEARGLRWLEAALVVFRQNGDRGGEATTLNNIGLAWDALGEKRKALEFYEQALPLSRAVGDRGGEATTLNNIGLAWDALGEKRKALEFYEQALPLSRAVGDRRGEAVTCFNIGMIHYQLGDLDRAIAYLERCVELDEQIAHPDLESHRRALNQLKAMRDGGGSPPPSEDDQMAQVMAALQALYAQGGEAAVRAALKDSGLPEEALAALLAQLAAGSAPEPQVSTLPEERVRMLAGNTIAVKIGVPDKLDEWRGELGRIRADFAGRGADWAIEVAFADALLAILDDQPPAIPPDNPYAGVVQQVLAALAAASPRPEGEGAGVRADRPATLPADAVQALAGNTVAVKTGVPDKRDEWRDQLVGLRADWAGRGDDYRIEVAFADALLAILDDQPPAIPPDNPYAGVVQQVLAALAAASPRPEGEGAGVRADRPATLPAGTVQALAGNTIAVKTGVPDKRDEWRGELGRIRADFAGRGADWAIEVAFADALLAILDDQPPAIPPDNPYAGVVQQVLAAIAGYRGA